MIFFLTCFRCSVHDRRLSSSHLGLSVLRRRFRLGAGQPPLDLGGRRREGQGDDFVPAQPRRGPAAGLGAAVPALPEPGLVGMLHHPPAQAVLQRVLVTFGKRLPFGIPELLHVLRPDFLGHHGYCSGEEIK